MSEPWQIPQSWAWVEAREIAEIVGGGTPRTDDPTNFEGGDVPWITPADLSGYKDKYISRGARNITRKGLDNSGARLMPEGAVLFSSRAPIGYVAIASNPVSTNQGFKSLALRPFIKPDYAYYYLQKAKDLAVELSSGTTFREISGAKAALIPFPVAPIAEQERIVAEIEKQFTRLDAAVAALKRIQANLKRYRAAVLKAACEGRLVPTEAELARREGRSYEPASVLLERILAERRSRWESAQLAKFAISDTLPRDDNWKHKYKAPWPHRAELNPTLHEGWIWCSLDQLSTRITDGTHQPPKFESSGIPFIFVQHVVGGKISFENTKFISEATYTTLNARSPVEVGDILYTAVGSYGVAIAVNTEQAFSFQRHIAHIKPSGLLSDKYLAACLNSSVCVTQAHRCARGVAQKTVTLGDLSRFAIPLPPCAEQERIAKEVARSLSVVENLEMTLEDNLARADRLRQSILKNAFGGRLVPQDPNDEPANVLLERIRASRNGPHKSAPNAPARRKKEVAHVSR